MKIKQFIKPLLISALSLGGLSLVTTPVNARHVRRYRVQTYRTSQKIHRHSKLTRRIHYRIHFRRKKYPQIHLINQHRPKNNRKRINKRHVRKSRVTRKYSNNRKSTSKKRKSRKRPVDFIKFNRPSKQNFQVINNHTRYLKNADWENWGKNRRETVTSYYGPKVTFKTLRFLPLHLRDIHLVQSIAVTPSGRFAFLGCDTYPYLSGYTRIIKVNLQKQRGGIKVGPRFKGGHGQALAYNSKNNQLWLLADHYGPMNHGSFDEISTHTLKPIHKINFKLNHEYLGNVLTFDNSGNIYNENHIRKRIATKLFKKGDLVFYKGKLTPHNLTLTRINQGLRRAPGFVIQGIAYNRRTKRLYLETDEAIMSLPIQKLGHLKSSDIRETILHGHREYEGISFDKSGHAYIVMARPNEILKSTKVF